MAFVKFKLNLAIPERVFNAIPDERKKLIVDSIRFLKSKSVNINKGKPNEEMTTVAKWHRCLHDEGKKCESEQEI